LAYLQAQVTYENQRPTVLQAQQSLQQALTSFAVLLLGMPDGTKIDEIDCEAPGFSILEPGVV
jgi:outer membrane protein TolC